ncbi:hypothetical protein SCB71_04575 [Herbiconiux sp. KACC 21604]|uniref:hypothetical protein n=1 Tax=unclassified Herbiconiux TaxID=2618217 RepID=UPI00149274EB|nr:hypothetical protein [Herbiconiux sp. SALV-R1]QJU52631.1 hypothetical protein HL652_02550 [Herbiconiux sp. SALV-R1]WPO87524.1 hypothetical protein SCB71_04575 [Herbiconiux sp. KACC 21604]
MTTEWLGGGLIIALAAVLWLVYLVPSWFRSRQYLATERNAVRLQQTLRILAETAEVPEEVRVEANARSIAEQERILKHRAAQRETEAVPPAIRAADRLRRSRVVTALVLGLSLAVAALGGVQLATNGTWLLLAAGAFVAAMCLIGLGKMAKAGRRLKLPLPEELARPLGVAHAPVHLGAFDETDAHETLADRSGMADGGTDARQAATTDGGWVPVAMPRPLYLASSGMTRFGASDSLVAELADDENDELEAEAEAQAAAETAAAAQAAAAQAERAGHEESLRQAAAEAEAALRERMRAQLETVAELQLAEEPTAPPAAPAPSRFARMGVIDADPASTLDLDAVLARRRAV